MQLLCGQCGRNYRVPDECEGHRARCPHCGHIMAVPRFTGDAPAEADFAVASPRAKEEGGFADLARHQHTQRIRITCRACKRLMVVSAKYSGQKVRCVGCGRLARIPFPGDQADLKLTSLEQLDEAPVEPLDVQEAVPGHESTRIVQGEKEFVARGWKFWVSIVALLAGLAVGVGAALWLAGHSAEFLQRFKPAASQPADASVPGETQPASSGQP